MKDVHRELIVDSLSFLQSIAVFLGLLEILNVYAVQTNQSHGLHSHRLHSSEPLNLCILLLRV